METSKGKVYNNNICLFNVESNTNNCTRNDSVAIKSQQKERKYRMLMMLLLWLLLRSFLELIIAQAKVLKTDIWKQMLGKKSQKFFTQLYCINNKGV